LSKFAPDFSFPKAPSSKESGRLSPVFSSAENRRPRRKKPAVLPRLSDVPLIFLLNEEDGEKDDDPADPLDGGKAFAV